MKLEVNINKKYFIILASLLVILTGTILVYTYGGTDPSIMGHTSGEIDLKDFCIFSPTATACPDGWTRSIAFDNRTIRGSSIGIGGTGGADNHLHYVTPNVDHPAAGGKDVADKGTYPTTLSSSWAPYVNVTICCKN